MLYFFVVFLTPLCIEYREILNVSSIFAVELSLAAAVLLHMHQFGSSADFFFRIGRLLMCTDLTSKNET